MLQNILLCLDIHDIYDATLLVFMNGINFASDILTDRVRNKEKQQCHYKLVQWKNKG